MSITINSESKVQGPTWIKNLIFPRTSRLVPSKARTIIWLFFKSKRSMGNLDNVDMGITLSDEPLSRRARGMTWILHLMVMWKALVLSQPSGGISLSVKAIQEPTIIFPTNWSIPSTEMLGVIYASPKTFRRALQWVSKFWNKDGKEILADVLFSYSITLYSLCLMNFKNSDASFSVIGLFELSEVSLSLPFFSLESLSFSLEG